MRPVGPVGKRISDIGHRVPFLGHYFLIEFDNCGLFADKTRDHSFAVCNMKLNYLEHWGLEEKPFEELADANYFYCGVDQTEALSRMKYSFLDDGMSYFIMTGHVGVGKTLLCRYFCKEELRNQPYLYLPNGNITYSELLHEMIEHSLGKKWKDADLLSEYKKQKLFFQILKRHFQNQKLVILIDEAQQMSLDDILKLRLLSNEPEVSKSIKLFLIGQPELRVRLNDVPQLEQRIGMQFHLGPLKEDEVKKYILFRILKSGSLVNMFSDSCFEYLYKKTNGVPRLINRYCKLALHYGSYKKLEKIQVNELKSIVEDFVVEQGVA